MEAVTLSFTPDELKELAKLLYLGSYFSICADGYNNKAMVNEIINRVCAHGMHYAPETNAFRKGGPGEPMFYVSHELDDECDPVIELYNDYIVEEYLPGALADRDFNELYDIPEEDDDVIFEKPELLAELTALQEKYKAEFEKYGVTHLRLEERK